MKEKTKITGIILALGIMLSATMLTIPALANESEYYESEQVGDRDRLKARDGACNGSMIQKQEQQMLRLHNQNCTGEPSQAGNRIRQNAANKLDNREANSKQYQYKVNA